MGAALWPGCPGKENTMVILIGGASHTGKTLLARKLLAQYHYPCLSMDHLFSDSRLMIVPKRLTW